MRKSSKILLAFSLILSILTVIPQSTFAFASVNTWETRSSVPFSERFETAVVKNKIYAIGCPKIAEYNPISDVWALKKDMPINRTNFVLAVHNDLIYVIGNDGLNQVYDPITEKWENKTGMPTPRSQLEANVVNGKIYLIAGRTGGQKSTVNLNEVYDPETDTWSTKRSIPYPVVDYASTVIDNKIYVIGGQNEFHAPDTRLNIASTQIYDTETNTWSMGADIPEIVLSAAAGSTTGTNAPKRIYVIGGIHTGIQGSNFNQVYDPETDIWAPKTRNISEMPTARAWLSVEVVNDLVYALGGSAGLFLSYTGTNEQYTPYQFEIVAPEVQILSPENRTYPSNNVSLVFNVNKPVTWMGYVIDNQETITINGNITLPDNLSNGFHNLTVHVKDEFTNGGSSETIVFNITNKPESAPISFILPIVLTAGIVSGTFLLIYFKKHKVKLS